MDFNVLAARRRVAGFSGTAILCLVLALAVDGMIAGGRKDPKLLDMLPGQSLSLSDTMPRGAEKLGELALRASDPRIAPQFTEVYSGFWLGGTLWRADLTLPAEIPPGEYTVSTYYQNGTQSTPPQDIRIRVQPNAAAVQASALSLTTRTFGLSPYVLAAMLLPLALLPMFACYLLSRRIAQALAAGGMTEIYRAIASPEGQRIFFTLAANPRLKPETRIEVLDERGQATIGQALVFAVKGDDVEAIMQEGVRIRPGTLARVAADSSISH